jgi:hypothetical protein
MTAHRSDLLLIVLNNMYCIFIQLQSFFILLDRGRCEARAARHIIRTWNLIVIYTRVSSRKSVKG